MSQSTLARLTASDGAVSEQLQINGSAKLKSVLIFAVSTGAQAEDFTVTINETGNFAPVIHTVAMANITFDRTEFGGGILLREGQTLDFAWDNGRDVEWFIDVEIEYF